MQSHFRWIKDLSIEDKAILSVKGVTILNIYLHLLPPRLHLSMSKMDFFLKGFKHPQEQRMGKKATATNLWKLESRWASGNADLNYKTCVGGSREMAHLTQWTPPPTTMHRRMEVGRKVGLKIGGLIESLFNEQFLPPPTPHWGAAVPHAQAEAGVSCSGEVFWAQLKKGYGAESRGVWRRLQMECWGLNFLPRVPEHAKPGLCTLGRILGVSSLEDLTSPRKKDIKIPKSEAPHWNGSFNSPW